MPGKSDKSKGAPADDFDDIIARAERLNASIPASTSASSSGSIKSITKSTDNANSSSDSSMPSDEELVQICTSGDLARLRRYLRRHVLVIGSRCLRIAATHGKLDVARCIIKEYGADANEADEDGNPPILVAAQYEQLALLRYMAKELGADVNKAAENGCTPLYAAAQKGHISLLW
jgi:hypothetical protein